MKYRAPGRVNLIGEHTDYNEGFVVPVALDLACEVTVEPRTDGRLLVDSVNLRKWRSWMVDEVASLHPRRHWTDYIVGVAQELLHAGIELQPATLRIESSVPVGAGLSSSASLEVAVALALLDGRKMDRLELALLCHRAENRFVGLPCGPMDQLISVFGEEESALKIDCRDLSREAVRLPQGIVFVAVNSMVKHALGESAYRQRVDQCRAACGQLGVRSLRDLNLEQLGRLSGVALQRARHIVTENERVESFLTASRRGDIVEMGRLMTASHTSLQTDYEVSCEELDFLVASAIAVEGVLGSRLTGGGFGGCTVTMMRAGLESHFAERVSTAYKSRYAMVPEVYEVRPSAGAGASESRQHYG